MDVEVVKEWNVCCHMPQPSSKSNRIVDVSHLLPLLELPTDRLTWNNRRVASLANPLCSPMLGALNRAWRSRLETGDSNLLLFQLGASLRRPGLARQNTTRLPDI